MERSFLFFKQIFQDSIKVSWTLFRIMIPTILVLKVIEESGGIVYLSQVLSPVMSAVGLPSELGLVWATTLLVNIYSGLLVLINLDIELSVAQASILGSMMLLAHSLPVEGAIARQAGVSLWATLLVRVGASLLFGFLLYQFYAISGFSQQEVNMLWQQNGQGADASLAGWAMAQIKNLGMIYLILTSLLLVLRILKLLGIEALMAMALSPLLRFLGISREATNLTIVGVTLGLSYGGGLLIQEARNGRIQPRDIFCSIMLLNLLHSVIEDTLLILLIGADLSAILWGRMIFSILLVSFISLCMRMFVVEKYQKYFYRSVSG
ncbi:hypothetical protein [Endozoicomonas elysicola]|uniref:Membrane protein n=1 Tax=Endozoicomonas elysicola TaxID=305900 RepID=A0A081K5T7_9GAMM|nr:hypothetical protein [Endozoicomonas elysicola]KEI69513.1 membrane protein [Endozoicomonas elysicola]